MNQQEIWAKVKELAESIAKQQRPHNTLDIASLKNKCVDLYEHIQILVPYTGQYETQFDMPTIVIEEMKPVIDQQINKPGLEEPVVEPAAETKVADNLSTPPVTEAPAVEEAPPVHREQPLLQDILARSEKSKEEEPLLHEKMAIANPQSGGLKESLHAKIESLKSAITLNKKIAFVNVLFGENTVEYTKAIDRLNSATGIDEAMRYYTELKHQYNWDGDSDLVKELQMLVEKRFG